MNAEAVQYLQGLLDEEIPLTRAMGVEVLAYDGTRLSLHAPLAPNLNHKHTAFGGSLYSLLVLAGWGLLALRLREETDGGHIVIQQGRIEYIRPVAEDFTARADLPEGFERFLRTYRRHGRARITIDAAVPGEDGPAAHFSGRYVVHR